MAESLGAVTSAIELTGATATLDLALVWQADEATPAVRAFLTAAEQLAMNEGWI
ncbi:hypothetical protein [Streptomyces sp. RTd22]|uniref:hypothetical protein n=1 Tax=Streptomyces sp. RTd22 TaxID=1841249 RepID=UPI00131B6B8D|nr:hypothetical protein [Streptomyces sp. RTd22]